jgi:hypothetical protein
MYRKLYGCDTLLKGLTQNLQHVAAELRQFLQEENAMMRQRHLTGHGDVRAADQSHIRDGVVESATRASRDQRHAVAGAAGDAVDVHDVDGFRQRHIG